MRFSVIVAALAGVAIACSSGNTDSSSGSASNSTSLELPPRPASSFSPWNRVDLVLYDTVEGREINLGPGRVIGFSPQGDRGNVGPYFAWTVTELNAAGQYSPQAIAVLHVVTEERVVRDAAATFAVWESELLLLFGDRPTGTLRVAEPLRNSPRVQSDAPPTASARLLEECEFDREEWTLETVAPDGTLTQLASTEHQWPGFTPDGRLTLSRTRFGADAIVDLDTLRYDAVLPDGVVDVVWSADFRYAAVGTLAGHDGACL